MDVQWLSPESIQDTSRDTARKVPVEDIEHTFNVDSFDLLNPALNTKVLSQSDEWFAAASNLITPTPPIHKPNTFTHAGQWYDGWETRRHNPEPFDWVVFRLGVRAGRVKGVEIDTGFFNGNHAPEVAVEGCYMPPQEAANVEEQEKQIDDKVKVPSFSGWQNILPVQECGGACRQAWLVPNASSSNPADSADTADSQPPKIYTHIRLLMYPDGGIGRFRLYGTAVSPFPPLQTLSAAPTFAPHPIDLASALNGALATRSSDQHFGHRSNLLLPGRGVNMGDGWETRRSRGHHEDWTTVRLAAPGNIRAIVVDTRHFRGNFPRSVRVEAAVGAEEPQEEHALDGSKGQGEPGRWTLLCEGPCGPDREHVWLVADGEGKGVESDADTVIGAADGEGQPRQYMGRLEGALGGKPVGWVKLVMVPDGGVKRLRVHGHRVVE